MKFKELGGYKDSNKKAEECDKKLAEIDTAQKKKKRIKMLVVLALIVVGLGAYLITCLVFWKADDSGHWHSILGSQISYAEHDYSLTTEVLPTCEDEGYIEYVCNTCGWVHRDVIAATGHTSDSGKVTKEPTCTEKGTKTYTCITCGAVIKTESIAAKGHTSDSGKVTKEPTCAEEGTKTYTCMICGAIIKTENVNKENAATLCNDYVYGGYDDWFLPSKDELNLMYENLKKAGKGGFASYTYWSSSEGSNRTYGAWAQDFGSGSQYSSLRKDKYRVRPVRVF